MESICFLTAWRQADRMCTYYFLYPKKKEKNFKKMLPLMIPSTLDKEPPTIDPQQKDRFVSKTSLLSNVKFWQFCWKRNSFIHVSKIRGLCQTVSFIVWWFALKNLRLSGNYLWLILPSSRTMPLFKVCDVSRTKRKAVVANSLEELIAKGTWFNMTMLIELLRNG